MRGISWLVEELLASQGLRSMESVKLIVYTWHTPDNIIWFVLITELVNWRNSKLHEQLCKCARYTKWHANNSLPFRYRTNITIKEIKGKARITPRTAGKDLGGPSTTDLLKTYCLNIYLNIILPVPPSSFTSGCFTRGFLTKIIYPFLISHVLGSLSRNAPTREAESAVIDKSKTQTSNNTGSNPAAIPEYRQSHRTIWLKAIKLLACIWGVTCSHLGQNTDHPQTFRDFPQSVQTNAWAVP